MKETPLVAVGIVVCSLSGTGIGEKVTISRLDAYEPTKPRKTYCDWRDQITARLKRDGKCTA